MKPFLILLTAFLWAGCNEYEAGSPIAQFRVGDTVCMKLGGRKAMILGPGLAGAIVVRQQDYSEATIVAPMELEECK